MCDLLQASLQASLHISPRRDSAVGLFCKQKILQERGFRIPEEARKMPESHLHQKPRRLELGNGMIYVDPPSLGAGVGR